MVGSSALATRLRYSRHWSRHTEWRRDCSVDNVDMLGMGLFIFWQSRVSQDRLMFSRRSALGGN